MMELTMSRDYRLVLGKLSLDLDFAEKFFTSPKEVLANFSLSNKEISKLLTLNKNRFEKYKEANALRACDCDSCCNGGEGKGNCSECFTSCCQ